MGSIVGTVGDRAGAKILLVAGQNLVLSSFPWSPPQAPGPPAPAPPGYNYVAFEFGWTKFVFQIVPGNATAGTFQVNVTNDQPTAQQSAGNLAVWDPLPAPMVEGTTSWSNPMTLTSGGRLFFVNSGPWAAFQVALTGYAGTTGYLLFAAEP